MQPKPDEPELCLEVGSTGGVIVGSFPYRRTLPLGWKSIVPLHGNENP